MNFKKSFISNLSKVMSMVLILSMVLSMLAISSAASGDASSAEALEENDSSVSTSLDVSPKKLLKASDPEIAGSKFIEYIGKESFEAAGHVERITGLETLDTYVFGNADGTRTVYFMAEDVKYVDENGETVEKDITLTSNRGGFETVRNDVSLFIPEDPADGIDVEYGEYFVKLTPVSSVKNVSGTKNGNSVSYSSVFGEKAELKYTPILSGIKEDIVLSEYVSNASYSFTLETNGLYLYSSKNGYYLAVDSYSDPIFYLGDIIVYDAAGKPDMGTMKVSTVKAGEQYTLTISANDSFLADPETVYPVTIDPTITIKDGSTANLIEDAPIFQNKPSTNFGAYTFNRVGMYNSDYGLSRTVVKLPGLTSSALYQAMSADDIIDVKFNVTETSGGSNYYVNIYPLTNTGWTESSVTWNNVGSYSSTSICSGKLYADTETSFDITSLVEAWKNGTRSASAGFIMVAQNESTYRSFASSEAADTTLRPSVVMTYKPVIEFASSCIQIEAGESMTITPTVYPTGVVLSWQSSDTLTVAVSSISSTSARIQARKPGTVTVTVTANDEQYVVGTNTFTVQVYRLPNPNAQNKTAWCWAASAKMVGEHNGGSGALPTGAVATSGNSTSLHSYGNNAFYGVDSSGYATVDAGQHHIVLTTFMNDGNMGASSPNHIESALQLSSKNEMEIETVGYNVASNDYVDLTESHLSIMNSELASNRWVVGLFESTDGSGNDHAIVIKSYNSSTNQYTCWDPWNDGEFIASRSELLYGEVDMPWKDDNKFIGFIYCR